MRADGSLWLVDPGGQASVLAEASGAAYGFPTWSPDGSQIAAVRSTQTKATVVVFDLERSALLLPVAPRVIFENPTVAPFYLSWTPDGKVVSFLGDRGRRHLAAARARPMAAPRSTAADRALASATGSPFYYDWIDADHLFVHIGSGPRRSSARSAPPARRPRPGIADPRPFRSADVSADGAFVAYVRTGEGAADAVVVAARDGSGEHTIPVFGMVAVDFSPVDATLATIGATEPVAAPPRSPSVRCG